MGISFILKVRLIQEFIALDHAWDQQQELQYHKEMNHEI